MQLLWSHPSQAGCCDFQHTPMGPQSTCSQQDPVQGTPPPVPAFLVKYQSKIGFTLEEIQEKWHLVRTISRYILHNLLYSCSICSKTFWFWMGGRLWALGWPSCCQAACLPASPKFWRSPPSPHIHGTHTITHTFYVHVMHIYVPFMCMYVRFMYLLCAHILCTCYAHLCTFYAHLCA